MQRTSDLLFDFAWQDRGSDPDLNLAVRNTLFIFSLSNMDLPQGWGSQVLKLFLALLAVLIPASDAGAMELTTVSVQSEHVLVRLAGPIEAGDAAAFVAYIGHIQHDSKIGLYLDSPGGLIAEAEKIAHAIHVGGYPVVVGVDGTCASACFMLFAASPERFAFSGARIGVHSASLPGQSESLVTMGLTTIMARDVTYYGVPPDIVGRMVTTAPQEMAWLTRPEEIEMGVRFLDEPTSAAPVPDLRPPAQSASAPSAAPDSSERQEVTLRKPDPLPEQSTLDQPTKLAVISPYPASTLTSPLFRQGLADRRSWNDWLGRLTGNYQEGAIYWTEQYRLSAPGPCSAVSATHDDGRFSAGCQEAKKRVTKYTRLRRLSLYSTGWDSLDQS